jgi:hypothetical protein
VNDLAGARQMIDAKELDPLDVADDCNAFRHGHGPGVGFVVLRSQLFAHAVGS